MAKALGISLVAEGVETDEQAQFLTSHGCDVLQGYLFSRPLPREDLAVFIAGHSTTDISGIAIASS
jgi:EAL domain-containing protein (putative c-di-GMP-specific phosphodiesterase class I)